MAGNRTIWWPGQGLAIGDDGSFKNVCEPEL